MPTGRQGARIIVLPLRRKPRPPRWWQRVLRRLRYGPQAASGGA